jgi:hypothetical protein
MRRSAAMALPARSTPSTTLEINVFMCEAPLNKYMTPQLIIFPTVQCAVWRTVDKSFHIEFQQATSDYGKPHQILASPHQALPPETLPSILALTIV